MSDQATLDNRFSAEMFYDWIMRESPDALWISDDQGTLIHINQACLDLLHLTQEEVVGKFNILKDQFIANQGFLPLVKSVFEKGVTAHFEVFYDSLEVPEMILEDRVHWVADVKMSPVKDSSGRVIYAISHVRDITQRKHTELNLRKSEERLKDIMNTVADWVWEVNELGRYTYSSPLGYEYFGSEREDLIGKTPFDFMKPEEAERVGKIFAGIVAQKAPIKDLENWNITKNGEEVCLLTNGVPIINENGELKGYRGVDKDITARKHMEAELIRAKEKAEESDRLKSAFLANMSHEVRTPMNGILGFAELLKDPDISEKEQRRYIDVIERSGVRMLSIINDIISLAKIESGQMQIYLTPVDLNSELEFLKAFFTPEAAKHGLAMVLKNSLPASDGHLVTDRDKVLAILTNLVKNALKFTSSGFIECGCEIRDEMVEFYVKDSGVGITAEHLEVIFDRFRQGSDLLNRNYEGAGLGLSISKGFVDMLGGSMWVESQVGKGSTFYFTIPYRTE